MWIEGTLRIEGRNFMYCVKHYPEPSEDYGIDGGRISKLEIRIDGEACTCRYDRGWDIRPADADTRIAYEFLLKKYN